MAPCKKIEVDLQKLWHIMNIGREDGFDEISFWWPAYQWDGHSIAAWHGGWRCHWCVSAADRRFGHPRYVESDGLWTLLALYKQFKNLWKLLVYIIDISVVRYELENVVVVCVAGGICHACNLSYFSLKICWYVWSFMLFDSN